MADVTSDKNKTPTTPIKPAPALGSRIGEPKYAQGKAKVEEKTEDEKLQEEADRKEAAEREARAKIKAAEDEGEVRNLAEKEADKLKLEGGEPIKSVAGKPSIAPPDQLSPPSQPPAGSANASATNPALAANDAVAMAPTEVDEAEKKKLEDEGLTVVPLHGTGAQPSAG